MNDFETIGEVPELPDPKITIYANVRGDEIKFRALGEVGDCPMGSDDPSDTPDKALQALTGLHPSAFVAIGKDQIFSTDTPLESWDTEDGKKMVNWSKVTGEPGNEHVEIREVKIPWDNAVIEGYGVTGGVSGAEITAENWPDFLTKSQEAAEKGDQLAGKPLKEYELPYTGITTSELEVIRSKLNKLGLL